MSGKYLLDTHIFIWWTENSKRLPSALREVMGSPDNLIYISTVSAWEMSLKLRTGKLRLRTTLLDCFGKREFEPLDIKFHHIYEYHKLPFHHKDPFDRMLIAQARVEACVLISVDAAMRAYDVPILGKDIS